MRARQLLPLLLLLAGCGGGGNTTPINPLSGQYRQLQAGDSCTYSFSGVYTPTGGSPTPVSGTAVHTVVSRNGTTLTVNHVVTENLYGTSSTQTLTVVETQNADGSTEEISDNEGANSSTRTVKSTYLSPGFIKVPLAISGETIFTDGEWSMGTSNVTGTAAIATALGEVNTYVLSGQGTSSAGYSSSSTTNVIPQLGFSVGWTENDDLPKVGQETVTFKIQSTTVLGSW